MGNVTFSLDEDLIRNAKVAAAKLDTSVNAVIRILLSNFASEVETMDSNSLGNFQTIFDFSMGKINFRQAQTRLNVDDRTLFVLMSKAGLPMPRLSEQETKKMTMDAEEILYG
jgi:hypothetical protein